jgi:CubicO group peptidase (beta-lactamase class C family)
MRAQSLKPSSELAMDSTNRLNQKQANVVDELKLDLNALPNNPKIDRILHWYLAKLECYETKGTRVPGAAVMVRQGNEIVHMNCYGYANLETGEKITPATLFDLGSLSKQFTAFAILSLVHSGKIDKKEFISTFFAEFPRYADSMTVEQLIHHTSALPDYIRIHVASRGAEPDWYEVAMGKSDDWYPQMAKKMPTEITNKDVVRWIASQALLPRKPDIEFEYSNSGYVLLAELVERVTQLRFSDYLKTLVFDELKMDNTYVFDESCDFTKDAPQIVNHATCYNGVKGIGLIPVGYTPLNFIYGDGNVHSTIVDLAKWDMFLHSLDFLGLVGRQDSSQNSEDGVRELLWAPAQIRNRKHVNYGAGWNLLRNKYDDDVEENGVKVTKKFESRAEYHRGEWLGWRSYFARGTRWLVPEHGKNIDEKTWESLGIIVLSNSSQLNTCRIARHISQDYWGQWKKDNIINRLECG